MGRKCAGFAIRTDRPHSYQDRQAKMVINAEPTNLKAHATIGADRLECAVVLTAVLTGTREYKVFPVCGHQRENRF